MEKQGNIRIASENMMPIIKKWLYSDKDIFLREIVANGVDAITKFKKLVDLGEAAADDAVDAAVEDEEEPQADRIPAAAAAAETARNERREILRITKLSSILYCVCRGEQDPQETSRPKAALSLHTCELLYACEV